MEYDYSQFGLSEAELFSRVDHNGMESEKITAPRYSYWQSVFRVFFRKKLNIFILAVLALLIALGAIAYGYYHDVQERRAADEMIEALEQATQPAEAAE